MCAWEAKREDTYMYIVVGVAQKKIAPEPAQCAC